MLDNKQAVAALEQLRIILGLDEGADVLALLNRAANDEWIQMDDYPNYAQHQGTGAVRSTKTRRILKPDSKGYVKCKNRSGKWVNVKVHPCI